MKALLVIHAVPAPVWSTWRALGTLDLEAAGAATVLAAQPPTLLVFRLRDLPGIGRNVVSVQLQPGSSGSTRVLVEAVFQPGFPGRAPGGARQVRRALDQLVTRLDGALDLRRGPAGHPPSAPSVRGRVPA